jgi:hypothetical protein
MRENLGACVAPGGRPGGCIFGSNRSGYYHACVAIEAGLRPQTRDPGRRQPASPGTPTPKAVKSRDSTTIAYETGGAPVLLPIQAKFPAERVLPELGQQERPQQKCRVFFANAFFLPNGANPVVFCFPARPKSPCREMVVVAKWSSRISDME